MGRWGTAVFQSDGAADFVAFISAKLDAGSNVGPLLVETVEELVAATGDPPLALFGDEALAAAEMIDAAARGVSSGCGLELAWRPTDAQRLTAARAIEVATQQCECAVGWYDPGARREWVTRLDVIHRRLGGAGLSLEAPIWPVRVQPADPEPGWVCHDCGCLYSGARVPFETLPESYRCFCGASKSTFRSTS